MVKTPDRQCPGADLWQIPLPTSPEFALARVRASCLGRGAFLTISLYCTTSPLGIMTINWVSEIMPTFVLIKATGLKTKQRQLACQARMLPGQNVGSDWPPVQCVVLGENVEGRRVHPAVNKYDQPGHSSLFTLLQETMFINTHPSIYKKTNKK